MSKHRQPVNKANRCPNDEIFVIRTLFLCNIRTVFGHDDFKDCDVMSVTGKSLKNSYGSFSVFGVVLVYY